MSDEISLETLRQQAAAAKARRAAAALTDEQVERAKLLAQLEEDLAAARADEKSVRAIRGAQFEAQAKAAAKGRYLVRFTDLASLLPEADPESLPGAGVLVLRSPPAPALSTFQREAAHDGEGAQDFQAIYHQLLMECIVFPDVEHEATGAAVSRFFESDLGAGTVITLGDAACALGGVVRKRTKRGRG